MLATLLQARRAVSITACSPEVRPLKDELQGSPLPVIGP
jgi:hypothetical protein